MMMNDLLFIREWFASHVDGDWEQENTLVIRSIGNPGWDIVVDLRGTTLYDVHIPYKIMELGDNDWWMIKVEKGQFMAAGDIKKLEFIISKFRLFIENNGIM
jgi:Immunity protein 53